MHTWTAVFLRSHNDYSTEKVYKMPGLLSPLQIEVIIPKKTQRLSQNNLANKQPIGILKTLVAYTVKRFRLS